MSTKTTSLHTVAIPVSDQEKAIEFYRDRLGLEITSDETIDQIQVRWVELSPPGSTVSIALIPAGDNFTTGRDTGIRLRTPDASALHTELSDAGVDVGDLLTWGDIPPMFHLHDLDGNTIYILE